MPPTNGFEQGLKLYYDQWLASLPDENDLAIAHDFSKRFERRASKIIKRQRKAYYPLVNRTWKRAALAVFIVLMLLMSIMSIGAVREKVIDFFVSVYKEFSVAILKPELSEDTLLEQSFDLTDLPEGYEQHSTERHAASIRYEYRHENGELLVFWQFWPDVAQFVLDTESVVFEDVLLGDTVGQYYNNKKQGNLFWYRHGYAFLLSGNLDKESLSNLALSVRTK